MRLKPQCGPFQAWIVCESTEKCVGITLNGALMSRLLSIADAINFNVETLTDVGVSCGEA